MQEAFYIATTGPPGPGADRPAQGRHQRRRARRRFVDDGRPARLPRPRPAPSPTLLKKTAALLAKAKRPVLYVGHGAVISDAGQAIYAAGREAPGAGRQHPARQGRRPEDKPLHLGMLGMHGTAYANKAVTNCDLHHGHRRALGRPHHRQAVASSARTRPRSTSTSTSPSSTRSSGPTSVAGGRRPPGDRGPAPAGRHAATPTSGSSRSPAGASSTRSSTRSRAACRAQHVLDRLDKLGGRDCIITTDVGQHQMWAAQFCLHHQEPPLAVLGRRRHHGLRLPGGHRRAVRQPGQEGLGHRRRRRLPDDAVRAGHGRAPQAAGQDPDHQQPLPGHGPPVAGAVLRQPPVGRGPGGQPRLRQAGRGLRHQGLAHQARRPTSTACSRRRWTTTTAPA